MNMNTQIGAKTKGILTTHEKQAEETGATLQDLLQPLKIHLYNFICKALNFSEDADDLFQETVVRAVKYFYSYKPGKSFKTWIFTIAHNEIKAYYNRLGKSQTPRALEEVDEIKNPGDHQVEQQVKDIYEIAGAFKPRDRKIFFLFYDQQFSIKEIAAITGLRQGNIKFILNRCREGIKSRLGLLKEQ